MKKGIIAVIIALLGSMYLIQWKSWKEIAAIIAGLIIFIVIFLIGVLVDKAFENLESIKTLKNKGESLEEANASLKIQLDNKVDEIARLTEERKKDKLAIGELNIKNKEIFKENSRLKQEIAVKDNNIFALNRELDMVKKLSSMRKFDNEKLIMDVKKLKAENKQLQDEKRVKLPINTSNKVL